MASSRGPFYKYELLKEIWIDQLSQSSQSFLSEDYFKNFFLNHGSFSFYIVRIYDGSSQLMLDENQYQAVKNKLEYKTRRELKDIPSQVYLDGSSGNDLEERREFSSQDEFEKELRRLKENERNVFRRARQRASELRAKLSQMVSKKPNMKFISYDLEIYDQDQKTILEIGYVKFTLKPGDNPEHHHAIVNEDLHNREGFDNKKKFKFGATKHVPLEEAAAFLQRGIAGSDALVTHSGYHGDKYLAENDISVGEKIMFDTQTLALALLQSQNPNQICWSLKNILEATGNSYDETIINNAGNDSHYTMMAFKALAMLAMPELASK